MKEAFIFQLTSVTHEDPNYPSKTGNKLTTKRQPQQQQQQQQNKTYKRQKRKKKKQTKKTFELTK